MLKGSLTIIHLGCWMPVCDFLTLPTDLKMANLVHYICHVSSVFSVLCPFSTSHFSLAGSWSVSLFLSSRYLLLLQGHCHPSNKQHTFSCHGRPRDRKRKRERECLYMGRQDTRQDSLSALCVEAGDDGDACYVCVWVVCVRPCAGTPAVL